MNNLNVFLVTILVCKEGVGTHKIVKGYFSINLHSEEHQGSMNESRYAN